MAAAKKLKKAQEGTELRKGQYKRIGRISEKNPERAERVADRMNTRASRVQRGKDIANPPKMERNPMYATMLEPVTVTAPRIKGNAEYKKGGVVKKKMQMGGRLKSSMNNLPPKSTGTTGYMVPAPKPKKADKPSGYETLPYKKDKPMMKQKMGGKITKKK